MRPDQSSRYAKERQDQRREIAPVPQKRSSVISAFIVAIQLAGLFLMVRIVMIISGMTFIGIPFVDSLIYPIARFIKAIVKQSS